MRPLEGTVVQKAVGPNGLTIIYVEARNLDIVMVTVHFYATYEIGDHFIGTVAQ
jgi:hypothetical protein